ncbi:MAG TPA: glutathione S-transferase family protein, partial [Hyphomicrobiaceae bacterium]|nr:glutathione S-transferase family protein [Hyphomicrobiaceae bacterium]
AEERPWEWRPQLLALNPSGELPILEVDSGLVLCGAYAISEYIAEEIDATSKDRRVTELFPGSRDERAEIRRLVDWFHRKMDREVTRDLLAERVYALMKPDAARPQPDVSVLKAARANLKYHLSYMSYLAETRRFIAGDEISFADLAGAAHLSTLDYLNEIAWDTQPAVKDWYQRLKSRRSFQPLLADRVPGLAAPGHYANIDF